MDLAKIHLRSGSVLAEGLFPEGLINVSKGHMRPTWKLTWRVWLDPIWPCRVLSRLVLRALASSWRVGLSCEYFGPSWRKGRVDSPALLGQRGPVRLSRGRLALGSDTGGDRDAMKAVCARSDSRVARTPRDASTLVRKGPSLANAASSAPVGFINDLQNVSNLLWCLPKVSFA